MSADEIREAVAQAGEAAREQMRAMGYMEAPTPSIRRATTLGLAVRAELERMEAAGDGC